MLEMAATYVVAYTHSGIALATILSIWLFKERQNQRPRMPAAVVVSSGLLILALDINR